MADLYSQLGQSMSSAIEYGGKGNRFWELDQIQQLYDIKRKRLEKLFNNLGYGLEAVTRIGDIHKRNSRLADIAKSRGYEIDTGFLGLGQPKYYRPEQKMNIYEDVSGGKLPSGKPYSDVLKTGDTYTKPREEVSVFDMFNNTFGSDNSGSSDYTEFLKLFGEK